MHIDPSRRPPRVVCVLSHTHEHLNHTTGALFFGNGNRIVGLSISVIYVYMYTYLHFR